MNNTLIKGLRIVELLAHAERPLSLTEIALRLGMEKSNVHRLLQPLAEMRYIARNQETGRYTASIRLWELGSVVLERLDLKCQAADGMQELMEATGESVHLSVMEQGDVVYVHKVDSLNPVRAYSQIGGRAPASCVATGKAILAYQAESVLRRLAADLRPLTPNTIIDPERFIREMAQIRRQGFAVNRGEWRAAVHGVAAPIGDSMGRVVAAVGVSGPAERFKPAQVRKFSARVMSVAARISAQLFGEAPARLW